MTVISYNLKKVNISAYYILCIYIFCTEIMTKFFFEIIMISVQKICMHVRLYATSSVNCEINTTLTLNTEKDMCLK